MCGHWLKIQMIFDTKNLKFAYFGQMFRYEQPQKYRQRQFYQAGVESVGTSNPFSDVELITMGSTILDILGIKYQLKINYIGSESTREKYQDELKKYLVKYKDQLNVDSQNRLENIVLRILDDKVDSQKYFAKKAPKINKFLSKEELDGIQFIIEYIGQLLYKIYS